jgi:acetyltransferase-like isoleucine patch superfamily enzyme
MSKIVIFGNGDIAELAHYYFTHDSGHAVAGFAVDSQYRQADAFLGLPNVDFESVEERFPPHDHDFFVAVSYAQMNGLRDARCRAAKDKGYRLVSYISSRATVFPDLSKHENCFVLEDNTVQPFVKIGNNVTLWSGNHIGHHSVIGDNTFITSHVVISGGLPGAKQPAEAVGKPMRWQKLGNIFCPSGQYPWMQSHAANPVADCLGGSRFRIYFSCRDRNNRASIGYVVIDMHRPLEVLELSPKPVLSPGEPGTFDDPRWRAHPALLSGLESRRHRPLAQQHRTARQ